MPFASPPSFWNRLRAAAAAALRHPAGRLFAALYVLAAVVFILATGDWLTLGLQVGLTVWRLATVLLAITLTTQPALAWEAPPAPPRPRLWLHLAVVAAAIGYTVFRSQALRSPEWEQVPLIGPLTAFINDLNFNLANPLLYVGVPLIALLLLGARPRALGLSLPRGRADWARTGVLAGVLASMNLAALVLLLAAGGLTPGGAGRRALSSLLQNGFSEEFLFRGALMTRLAALGGTGWAVVLSSLAFGLWHLSANLPMFGGSLLAALAFSIISQGLAGIVFAAAFQRGGNLVAPSAAHVLSHFNPF